MINRKYNLNENYFDNIDNQNKAYLLGLLYSDGNIYTVAGKSHVITFAQRSDREELVNFFKEELESDRPIVYQIKQLKNGELHKHARFVINSKKICDDLQKLGIYNKKSLILTWPNKIPEEYMSHFIRGLFDGDGCVWNGKRKKMWVNDLKCKNGRRERIIHNVKFTYVGSNTFIQDFQNYLISVLGFTKTKINYSKAKDDHHYGVFEYSGRKNLRKFYDYIYKDAILYCKQKKNKFEEIFSALSEKSLSEMGLIAGTPETVISSQASSDEVEGSSTTSEMMVEVSTSECPTPNE